MNRSGCRAERNRSQWKRGESAAVPCEHTALRMWVPRPVTLSQGHSPGDTLPGLWFGFSWNVLNPRGVRWPGVCQSRREAEILIPLSAERLYRSPTMSLSRNLILRKEGVTQNQMDKYFSFVYLYACSRGCVQEKVVGRKPHALRESQHVE